MKTVWKVVALSGEAELFQVRFGWKPKPAGKMPALPNPLRAANGELLNALSLFAAFAFLADNFLIEFIDD